MSEAAPDAIVVGSGPNGLAAAITLARAGRSVRVYEAASTIGGGTRTDELTLPGFRHDVCSTILPLTIASPFFRSIDLAAHGVEVIQPDAPVAHALDDGRAAVLERSVAVTADGLGRDGPAWRRLFGPLVADADKLAASSFGRSSTCPATPWRWPASGYRPSCPPPRWPAWRSGRRTPGPCSPAWRPTRWSISIDP